MHPDLDDASPVVLLTNCCIYPFDEKKYSRTKTKMADVEHRTCGTSYVRLFDRRTGG